MTARLQRPPLFVSTPGPTRPPPRSSVIGLPPEVDRGTSCTATSVSAKRGGQIVLRRARACRTRSKHGGPRSASVGPYSATVAPIPTKPATPIHRSRPSDGSSAISRPGMPHGSVIFMLNPILRLNAMNFIVKEAGRRVGIIDDSLSYYALRQRSVDDLWVSVKYVLELDRLVFLNLYGLKEPPPRDDYRWQLWRDAGALAVEREGLGSVVYPIL
ncbi:hypothetical protein THAOC_35096, partial [Thalassiosira oceanica]